MFASGTSIFDDIDACAVPKHAQRPRRDAIPLVRFVPASSWAHFLT